MIEVLSFGVGGGIACAMFYIRSELLASAMLKIETYDDDEGQNLGSLLFQICLLVSDGSAKN
jgi:hypothetical protein